MYIEVMYNVQIVQNVHTGRPAYVQYGSKLVFDPVEINWIQSHTGIYIYDIFVMLIHGKSYIAPIIGPSKKSR